MRHVLKLTKHTPLTLLELNFMKLMFMHCMNLNQTCRRTFSMCDEHDDPVTLHDANVEQFELVTDEKRNH